MMELDEPSITSSETSDEWSVSDSYSSSDDDCDETSDSAEEDDIDDDGGLIIEGALESNAGIEAFVNLQILSIMG
eukprot:gnl/Chilomastix_caulleri/1766.p1 GENE.gnl/Chilomastix_caulleri/1766~~gnl/Chilomastix_caulleri/1766.p1  ORF type:complete len:75 (-),score=24.76 gnl/Chilomastix_caulleri/1766:57-281(-)